LSFSFPEFAHFSLPPFGDRNPPSFSREILDVDRTAILFFLPEMNSPPCSFQGYKDQAQDNPLFPPKVSVFRLDNLETPPPFLEMILRHRCPPPSGFDFFLFSRPRQGTPRLRDFKTLQSFLLNLPLWPALLQKLSVDEPLSTA